MYKYGCVCHMDSPVETQQETLHHHLHQSPLPPTIISPGLRETAENCHEFPLSKGIWKSVGQ